MVARDAALMTLVRAIAAKNKTGSTPMQLATWTTGRGGSGSPESRRQQEEIVRLLERHGATR
jgi:hypothetical protein